MYLKGIGFKVVVNFCVCSMLQCSNFGVTPSARDASSQTYPVREFQKGMCYVSWERDKYRSAFSDESLERLAALGTEWVSMVVTWYQEDAFSTEIAPSENTPSDESLRHAIARARELGLKVMLKPHVDLAASSLGSWRGDICQRTEAERDAWFERYCSFILHYAGLASETDADMLCVGTELSLTSEWTEYWEGIIAAVRTVYCGPLTYAAHWDGEYQKIQFWPQLDYIGIDAYFPLTDKDKPSLNDIKLGWKKWINVLEPWALAIGKPVIFTEIGYSSACGAARFPWEEKLAGNPDTEIQKRCYRAFFETVCGKEWLAGVYWWKWNTNVQAGGACNKGFTPQNKPAETVLAQWYQRR